MTSIDNERTRKPPTILEAPVEPDKTHDDDGLGPTNEDENKDGLAADKGVDTVDLAVKQYDQALGAVPAERSKARSTEEIDETSAGGLRYPDDKAVGS